MQLTTLKQSSTKTDPVLQRLEKNGFSSRPSSAATTAKKSSVGRTFGFV